MRRKMLFGLFVIMLMVIFVKTEKTEVFAGSKKSYIINAHQIKRFEKSNKKLNINGEKGSICEVERFQNGMYYVKSGQPFQKTKLSFKLAKTCKWKHRNVNQKIQRTSYGEMKKKIRHERSRYKRYKKGSLEIEYETNFSIIIITKNNKIVEVIAYGFF